MSLGTIKRTIMIFPQFDNIKFIDILREKYDPLADKVRPHITLVFPFESELSAKDIDNILTDRLSEIKSFEIKLRGLSVSGSWLFVNVINGVEKIIDIHNGLYDNEFSKYKPAWLKNYSPHITVGCFDSYTDAKTAYDNEIGFNETFYCKVDKISAEIIGSNEESIIDAEYMLA